MDSVKFLLDLSILLFTAKAFGLLAKRIGVPEVVGQIVAGLVFGPALLGVVQETDFLEQMAEIGVMMIMFEAGLNTDLKEMAGATLGKKINLIVYTGGCSRWRNNVISSV